MYCVRSGGPARQINSRPKHPPPVVRPVAFQTGTSSTRPERSPLGQHVVRRVEPLKAGLVDRRQRDVRPYVAPTIS